MARAGLGIIPHFHEFNIWALRDSSESTSPLPGVRLKPAIEWGCVSELRELCTLHGGLMNSYKAFLFLILVACLVLDSCSGLPKGNGGGGGGTANVSFVMVAHT